MVRVQSMYVYAKRKNTNHPKVGLMPAYLWDPNGVLLGSGGVGEQSGGVGEQSAEGKWCRIVSYTRTYVRWPLLEAFCPQ